VFKEMSGVPQNRPERNEGADATPEGLQGPRGVARAAYGLSLRQRGQPNRASLSYDRLVSTVLWLR
jgi:hypothetical protein